MSNSKIHEGYLMIDHRASPGTDEIPGGTLFEAATMHCAHCGTVVIINPNRTRERAWCVSCDKYVCDNCGITMKLPDYVHKSYKQSNEELYNKLVKEASFNG